ncbi:hypothetical protein MNBD_ALPHA04-1115 [hydrothermal vent metagenome]|uniref:DOMON-like domain-containing protein n=1 Tax=hydrothermal vent metagenome TaxID=652676 RepID=A0A3B0RTU2_9ZZZZ
MRLTLQCHPDTPTAVVSSVAAKLEISTAGKMVLDYKVCGELENVKFLEQSTPKRMDCLWQHSCFEAFISRENSDSYFEFNFSPSTEWAAYKFGSYRKGMAELDMPSDPVISMTSDRERFSLNVQLNLTEIRVVEPGDKIMVGLSTIIEEQNGYKSLWALQHPSGNPDFHNRECFAQELKVADWL